MPISHTVGISNITSFSVFRISLDIFLKPASSLKIIQCSIEFRIILKNLCKVNWLRSLPFMRGGPGSTAGAGG